MSLQLSRRTPVREPKSRRRMRYSSENSIDRPLPLEGTILEAPLEEVGAKVSVPFNSRTGTKPASVAEVGNCVTASGDASDTSTGSFPRRSAATKKSHRQWNQRGPLGRGDIA